MIARGFGAPFLDSRPDFLYVTTSTLGNDPVTVCTPSLPTGDRPTIRQAMRCCFCYSGIYIHISTAQRALVLLVLRSDPTRNCPTLCAGYGYAMLFNIRVYQRPGAARTRQTRCSESRHCAVQCIVLYIAHFTESSSMGISSLVLARERHGKPVPLPDSSSRQLTGTIVVHRVVYRNG